MTDPSDAYEIFLSYARVDNERETEDEAERGWVDHFQLHLLKQLRRRGRADGPASPCDPTARSSGG